MKGSSYFLIITLLVMAAVVVRGLTFPFWESKFLPILLGSIGFVLAAVQLGRELLLKDVQKTNLDQEGAGDERLIHRFSSMYGWTIGFFLFIFLLGFLISIPLFVLAYLRWRHRSWLTSVGLAGILTVLIYLTFELGLRIELYRGLLFKLMAS